MSDDVDPRTLEQRERDERVIDGHASVEDHLDFAHDELKRANAALPPTSKTAHGDGYHASACVQRAMSSIRLARKMVSK